MADDDIQPDFSDDELPESDYESDDSARAADEIANPDDYFNWDDNSPETNTKIFSTILDSDWMKKEQEQDDIYRKYLDEKYDFPVDPENWKEEDLMEYWADAPLKMKKPGWDPNWVDDEEIEVLKEEIEAGEDPPIAPFYVPYRKSYPVIPNNHKDISTPKQVIEELDRTEEFLTWVSYIFKDGSSYEGTVWDDLAHGKGVYEAEQGLVRYEGEWLQNNMEGHGVVEVEIPDIQPVPGSKLEEEMRAEGKIITRDFMSPEDRKWLEMDIEDSVRLAGGRYEIPFYENDLWIKQFGQKPEVGRYRYAGQWKHGRMHGCGVYEVNERTIYGRFYFGELVEEDTYGCDVEICALHSGIAEVAAAKARMFINKPDGMVREERGPYSDPQHPYLYEEEDVWMAPGFINQFYEVPDYWKRYVYELDEERQMWLNSFYKAPLRLPMPPELEYWWENDENPEFILVNKEPEPDPKDPSKLIYTEDPLILHTPTGRLINYVDDEEHGIRLFWQPPLKDGEDVDPAKARFLPIGFDEFYGRVETPVEPNIWMRLIQAIENTFKPISEKLDKWTEELKKDREMKVQVIEKELELQEAELTLKEVIEDMDEELKRMQEEEEKKTEKDLQEEEEGEKQGTESEKAAEKEDDIEEEDEEDEDAPSSFGSAIELDSTNNDKGVKNGRSPFAAASLSYAPSLVSVVSSQLQRSFSSWKGLTLQLPNSASCPQWPLSPLIAHQETAKSHSYSSCSFGVPPALHQSWRIRTTNQTHRQVKPIISNSRLRKHPKHKTPTCEWPCAGSGDDLDILSLCTPV